MLNSPTFGVEFDANDVESGVGLKFWAAFEKLMCRMDDALLFEKVNRRESLLQSPGFTNFDFDEDPVSFVSGDQIDFELLKAPVALNDLIPLAFEMPSRELFAPFSSFRRIYCSDDVFSCNHETNQGVNDLFSGNDS